MCCCFIASFKSQRYVGIIITIILSNKVVTAAIRVGCLKKIIIKKHPLFPQIFIMAC